MKRRYTEDPEAVAVFDQEVQAYYRDVTLPFMSRMNPPAPEVPSKPAQRPVRSFRHRCCCKPVQFVLTKLADHLLAGWRWNH